MGEEARSSILIIDDNPINLEVVSGLLSESHYDIYIAKESERALERAKRIRPELILLDVKMPGMDGFEVCRLFQADPELCTIPIIFMTALDDDHHKERAFQVGAVDYITKPVRRGELLGRIATHLEISRYRLRLEEEVQRRSAEIYTLTQEQSLLLDNMESQVWYLSKPGRYGRINLAHAQFLGLPKTKIEGQLLGSFLPESVAENCLISNRQAFASKVTVYSEEWAVNADGKKRLLSITRTPKQGADGEVESVICVARDITDEWLLKQRLTDELKEKELLLQEVNHRVKNNLNVMMSLLNLQLEEVEAGGDAVQALRSSADRIYAMGQVHQQAYENGSMAAIDLHRYIRAIIERLKYRYDQHNKITIDLDICVGDIEVVAAIPIGMIVSEIVTSIMHRNSGGNDGHLSLLIDSSESVELMMELSCRGVDHGNEERGFSRDLINALCSQIDAEMVWGDSGPILLRVARLAR